MEYVSVETARALPGLRLVVPRGIPSPWSEAAKAICRLKEIPTAFVGRGPPDAQLQAWTGANNVPVAMYNDEPARTGWDAILLLAERIAPSPRLVPAQARERARLFGLAHELLGELGLVWCTRLVGVDISLKSEGARGFPLSAARYLSKRYGHGEDVMPEARRRIADVLSLFSTELATSRAQGHRYLLGPELTALDIYLATSLIAVAPLPEHECPMIAPVRKAFSDTTDELRSPVPDALLAFREQIYRDHLGLPMWL